MIHEIIGLYISKEIKKIVRHQFEMQIIFLEQLHQEKYMQSLNHSSNYGFILLDEPAKEYEEPLKRIILKNNEYETNFSQFK